MSNPENIDDNVDYWQMREFGQVDNPHGMLEESSFTIMFPKYREQYFTDVWSAIASKFSQYGLTCNLDVIEGSVRVTNSKKTWDPFIVIKAKEMLQLISRSVPYEKAVNILEDNIFCEVIKIKNTTKNMERFVKRRSRLIGSNGTTLKSLELLTDCYIQVQGGTVTVIGPIKGVKTVRKVVEDTMFNVHPIYNLKALIIKKELAKDEKMLTEDWTRFIPQYKNMLNKNTPAKSDQEDSNKPKKLKKKVKKPYTPFPPAPVESKIDKQLASGEYFLKPQEKRFKRNSERVEAQKEKSSERQKEKLKRFKPTVLKRDDLTNN